MTNGVDERLAKESLRVGDIVRITTTSFQGEGRLMPRHAFSAPDCVILKLDSGYNVGVRLDDASVIEKMRDAGTPPSKRKAEPPTRKAGKPQIAILGTGGTIASYVDYRTGAVHPAATADELAFATPEIFDIVDVASKVVFQVFSEDLTPENWKTLAREVAKAFGDGARGVVIPHGTDTMGYTAAALSFLLRDLPGPVVLVGAQRSSDRPSSDAATNLLAACRVAATADLGEVVVAMHASSSDDLVAIHRGVRVRKNHTSRRDAFQSVNQEILGHVAGDRVELTSARRLPAGDGPTLVEAWEPDVGLLLSHPGMGPEAIRAHGGKGLVIAGTGLGHIPESCLEAIEEATHEGRIVVMTSQCIWGRTNLRVYSRGRDLLARGVVEAGDMLPEVAWVKLQHSLGVASDRDEAIRVFHADVAGETAGTTPFLATEAP